MKLRVLWSVALICVTAGGLFWVSSVKKGTPGIITAGVWFLVAMLLMIWRKEFVHKVLDYARIDSIHTRSSNLTLGSLAPGVTPVTPVSALIGMQQVKQAFVANVRADDIKTWTIDVGSSCILATVGTVIAVLFQAFDYSTHVPDKPLDVSSAEAIRSMVIAGVTPAFQLVYIASVMHFLWKKSSAV